MIWATVDCEASWRASNSVWCLQVASYMGLNLHSLKIIYSVLTITYHLGKIGYYYYVGPSRRKCKIPCIIMAWKFCNARTKIKQLCKYTQDPFNTDPDEKMREQAITIVHLQCNKCRDNPYDNIRNYSMLTIFNKHPNDEKKIHCQNIIETL